MRSFQSIITISLLVSGLAALVLRLVFFGISVSQVPESSDESLSTLQAKMIVEGHTPLLVMANPYQFPVESYAHAPFVKILLRNAFGARIIPFCLSLAATAVFIALLFLIAPLRTGWPALLLLLFPSAYVLMLNSAYFIPQHSSFALLFALALYFTFRMREAFWPARVALIGGFFAGLAFSNHILAIPLLIALGTYVVFGPKLSVQLRVIPAFAAGIAIGLVPYLLAIWLIPGSYGAVAGTTSCAEVLKKLWGPALNSALTGVMGINPCLFPDNRHTLALIPGFGKVFAIIWILILLAVSALRMVRFIRRAVETRVVTVEPNDVFLGLAWLGFLTFLFSARSLSHTYRYLLPVAWAFPFMVGYLYARAPKAGRILVGAFAVFLAGFNIIVSLALMREWGRENFAEKEANLLDLKPAIQYLVTRGVHHACASYWLAYRVTYETGGRILCSQPGNERFPGWPLPYKREVDASPNVAYIMAPKMKFDMKRFENDLAVMGVACRREPLGKINIYTEFKNEKPFTGVPIPRENWRVLASHNQADAALLVDGNPRSFWQVTNACQREMWIRIDLPEPETINRIVIIHTGFPRDFVGLRGVMGRTEEGWADLIGRKIGDAFDRFAYRNGHPVYGEPAQILTFAPFKTDCLELLLYEPTKHCNRVISEIELYRMPP